MEAAAMARRGALQVTNTRRAFELLQCGIPDIDLLIVDLDWQFHPRAILEAIAACKTAPPVIVLTDLEEQYMGKIARRYGVTACLGKPFAAARLATLIRSLVSPEEPVELSCDLWGHPKLQRRLQKQAA
jgi:AmiR/NasT family two-component response regulator